MPRAILGGNLRKLIAHRLAPVTAQHSLGTQVITLEPPAGTDGKITKASCVSYCVVSHFGKGEKEGKPLYAYVRYEDKLAKAQSEWRITNRTLSYMVRLTLLPECW